MKQYVSSCLSVLLAVFAVAANKKIEGPAPGNLMAKLDALKAKDKDLGFDFSSRMESGLIPRV